MHFQGDVTIKAPRERIWDFLTDPRRASQCVPDLQRLDVLDDRRFRAVGAVNVGPIKGMVTVEAVWVERDAPTRGRIKGRGKLPGGTADADVTMILTEVKPTRTTLNWEAEITLKGMIAMVGGRFLPGAVDVVTKAAFSCVKSRLKAEAAAAATPGQSIVGQESTSSQEPTTARHTAIPQGPVPPG